MSRRPTVLPSFEALVTEHDRLVERVNSGELSESEEETAMEHICVLEMAYLNHPDRPLENVNEEAL